MSEIAMSPLLRTQTGIVDSPASVMTLFEATKEALRPHLLSWHSRSITIVLTTLAAAVLSRLALRAYGSLRRSALDARGAWDRSRDEKARARAEAALLRAAIESAVEGVLITDASERIAYANSAALKMTGYSREDIRGQNLRLLQSGIHDAAFYEGLRNTVRGGRGSSGDSADRPSDRSVELTTIAPALSEGREVTHFITLKEDVTERTKDEDALERMRYTIDHAGDCVLWTDEAGQLIYANQTASRNLGYSPEEILGLSVWDIDPDLSPGAWPQLWEQSKRERTCTVETRRRCRDGTIFPVELSITHVSFHGHEYQCVVGHDISERQRAQQALHVAERRYSSLFDGMTQGFAHCRMLFENGQPRDFVYLEVNPAFETLTGLQGVVGKRVAEVIPGIREANPELFETYGRVALSGQPERLVTYVDPLKIWFDISVYSQEREHFVAVFDNITERKRMEGALRASEERYRLLFERNLAGVYRSTLDGRILECNEAFVRIFGYSSREEVRRGSALQLYPSAQARDAFLERLRKEGSLLNYESEGKRKDGERLRFLENATLVEGNAIEGTLIDVTGQRKLEEQLRHAQKMEAIGRLAGGVAHDFNNLLQVIVGYGDIVLKRLPSTDPLYVKVAQILRAAERAGGLTRQLLAFSRQQVLRPKILDLNVVVSEMDEMLRRVIGEDIELVTLLEPHLGSVKADPGQLEQIIMNLAVNARDAMPDGGRLTIETSNADLGSQYAASHPSTTPGPHVMVAISDTGAGMDDKTRARIFEPFFTTKELGKGTGLGLSTVYGIVKQSGGWIWVYSEVGLGTTFKVYLPRIEEAAPPLTEETLAPPVPGSETILLVEDEAALRDLLRETFEANGYTILVAREGAEALQMADAHAQPIDLMVTDVIMPGMTGRRVADAFRQTRPELKVLYISGYADEAIVRHGVLDAEAAFLGKPFTSEDLLRKVRELLDGH